MGGLTQQRTSAREVHVKKFLSKPALVTGGKPWQRSVTNLWGQMGQTLLEALVALWALAQLSSSEELDVVPLLVDKEGLLPSHLHVLPRCDSGEHRQFLLINVLTPAVPPVPFSGFGMFRSQTYLP